MNRFYFRPNTNPAFKMAQLLPELPPNVAFRNGKLPGQTLTGEYPGESDGFEFPLVLAKTPVAGGIERKAVV